MKKILIAIMCIFVIGGTLYGGIYTEKKLENPESPVQAVASNKIAAKTTDVMKINVEKKSIVNTSKKVVVIDPGHSSIVDLSVEP